MSKLVGRRPVEIKISELQNGYIPVFDNSSRLWTTINKEDLTSGSAITSGSNIFIGNQTISGSVIISGSLEVNGKNYINDSSSFESRINTNSSSFANFSGSYVNESSSFADRIRVNSSSFANFSGSYVNESSSFADRIRVNSSSFADFSGSYINESASFASRINVNSSSISLLSGSYLASSASFDTRITTNSGSIAQLSGSYLSDSSSFASRITTNSSSFASFSGSYLSDSSSFASRITTNSASISSLSASFATFSGSFNTGSFTGSFVGSLTGTASYATQALSASYAENAPNYLPLAGGTMTGDIYAAGRTFTFQDLLLGAGTTFGKITTDGSKYISIMPTYNVESARFWSNGNVTIQDAGTYVDNGFRLDVSGSGRFTDGLTVTGSLQAVSGITGSLLGTASQASTASSADNFTVRGTLTAQTLVAQTITSSIEFITGSTRNGSLLTNTHQFTGSVGITGSLTVNGSDYITTSGSASTRLTALETFSGSYSTGSFTGSFIGRHTGSFSGSLYNLQNTVLGHIPFYSASQVLADSIVRQLDNGSGSYSIVINQDNITVAAPEALYVWQPSTTSYNVIAGKGNLNSYLQLNIQNTNTGENASSDVVATANNGNETSNYIDMGINSEGFTGSIGNENDAYLYSTGKHLHIGTATNYPIQFFAGGIDNEANRKFQLNPNNSHELTGSLSITNRLNVIGGVTASLQGTASWANNATTASYAIQALSASYWSGSVINADTASYVLNAVSSSFASTASYVLNAVSASFITLAQTASFVQTAQTASYVLQAVSASFASTASYVLNAVSASFVTLAQTASFVQTAQTASYVLNAVSSSFASTASSVNRLNQNVVISGSLTVTGSTNIIGSSGTTLLSSNADTLVFTGSLFTTGSIISTGSLNILGGITGSLFGTASYAVQALSASYWSGSVINAATASYVQTAQTASYVLNAVTASYVQTAQTASYVLNAVSASNASTASYLNPIENSYLVLSQVSQSLNFQDDAEAAAGGVPLGGLYRNGNFILIRIV